MTTDGPALHGDGAAEPERWRRVEALLAAALERDAATRDAFLDAACAGDPPLRREVASLVTASDASGAMDRLADELAPAVARVRGAAAPMSGQRVGHYRVLEPVGGGGMGVVYKALDVHLDRTVALKFLQPRLDADDSAAERFRMEARTIAALEHPNICTLHEIGETPDGQLFLAMPLYDGETLQRRIARGPLPVHEAVDIAVQVARGLAKAHARGIVHRDVKPSNVLVSDDGVVKLLDFGIATLADATLGDAQAGPVGTAAYMSPEQAAGGPVDSRTDLWSLGVVLHEMLAGRRPTGDGAAFALDGVPPALRRIVATALAPAPQSRYQSAKAFESELRALDLARPMVHTRGNGPPRARSTRRALVALTAVLALAGTAAAAWSARDGAVQRPAMAAAATPAPAMIAVLPLIDRSAERDQAYLGDGLTDELIATLVRVHGVRVASSTSTFALRGSGLDVRAVGERLGAATVLDGSLRRAGDRLHLSVRLLNAADGEQLWAESYDRAAGDGFAIQSEIARAVAHALRSRLAGAAGTVASPPSIGHSADAPDAVAYDSYLRGRYAWYTRSEEGTRSAVRHFERAVARAPRFARAQAGLADAYAVLGFYEFLPPSEAFPKAAAAARRAIALDSTLGAPHATLGYVALYHDWNLVEGEVEFRRAIALEPDLPTPHQWYANLLVAAGRFPEAEREMRRAGEIDPTSLVAKAALGWAMHYAGNDAAAVAQSRETLLMNSHYALAHLWGALALESLDSLPQAIAAYRRAIAAADSSSVYVAGLARALALDGQRVEAERLLRRLETRGVSGRYVSAYEIAKVHEALGRPDAAFVWLERALAQRSHSMVLLRVDPQFARLRRDPRFGKLLRDVFGEHDG